MSKKRLIKNSDQAPEKRLQAAESDFQKLMKEIEPFIGKSEVVFKSTDGKWFDTAAEFHEIEPIENACYR
jgi:hypothetical protein